MYQSTVEINNTCYINCCVVTDFNKEIDILLYIKSTDFTAMKVNVVIFGIMTSCSFIGGCRRFGRT
jgi:hypothetical protein